MPNFVVKNVQKNFIVKEKNNIMSYKPKTISSGGSARWGLAKVAISKDKSKVQVLFKDDPQNPIILFAEDCPDNIKAGKWIVSLSEDETIMFSFKPEKGTFTVKVKEFVVRDSGIPEPRLKEVSFVRDGKKHEYSYEYFMVLLEILEPERYAGLEITAMMRYHFGVGEISAEGKDLVGYTKPTSKYTSDLQDFLDATKAWELGPIEYSDNILPELQKRILHAANQFSVTLKDGWIVNGSIMSYDEPDQEEVPWEETTTETQAPSEQTQSDMPDFDEDDNETLTQSPQSDADFE